MDAKSICPAHAYSTWEIAAIQEQPTTEASERHQVKPLSVVIFQPNHIVTLPIHAWQSPFSPVDADFAAGYNAKIEEHCILGSTE
jgi:hypothetical protein